MSSSTQGTSTIPILCMPMPKKERIANEVSQCHRTMSEKEVDSIHVHVSTQAREVLNREYTP